MKHFFHHSVCKVWFYARFACGNTCTIFLWRKESEQLKRENFFDGYFSFIQIFFSRVSFFLFFTHSFHFSSCPVINKERDTSILVHLRTKFQLHKSKFAWVRQFWENSQKIKNLKKFERFNRFWPNSIPWSI